MTRTSPDADELDQLLGAYFKAQVPHPWPAPPATAALSEPTGRLAAPESSAGHDPGRRARYTLAASVALLLGTCWTLSNGLPSGPRAPGPQGPGGPAVDLGTTNAKTPEEIHKVLHPQPAPRNDMLDKSN